VTFYLALIFVRFGLQKTNQANYTFTSIIFIHKSRLNSFQLIKHVSIKYPHFQIVGIYMNLNFTYPKYKLTPHPSRPAPDKPLFKREG
jgi:hypothetical protein